ncbi:MAG TPA: tetratricopeptide repeat protein [Bdellovibrionales bacterium]|nr:tetratricopeptide repeat protein [Bdellovibrionales bacterium]
MSELEPTRTFVEPLPLQPQTKPVAERVVSDTLAGPVYREDQRAKALQDFDRDSDSQELKSVMSQALLLIDNGDYRLAQVLLRRILERDPLYTDAIRWQAYCFRHTGDIENAIRCGLAYSKIVPGEESFCQLAEFYYTAGNETEAIKYYEKALSVIDYESPNLFEICKNLGNICIRAGNVDAAEENYNRAYTLSPHSDVLLVNFGTLEIQRKNYDLAASRFREALNLNQHNDKAWVGLALVNRQKSDVELGWGNLERALDLNPHNLTALSVSIQWGIEDWRFDVPIRRLKEFLARNGEDSNMSYSLAALLFRSGRVQEAQLEIERTLNLDPNRADAQELRAKIRDRSQ